MGSADADALPRLIEACPQTAGLLEVATFGRMMIPSRIADIRWFGDVSCIDAPLFAVARRSSCDEGSVDIDVVDAGGSCHLRVVGYDTVPLPFASDGCALEALAAAFRRTTPSAATQALGQSSSNTQLTMSALSGGWPPAAR